MTINERLKREDVEEYLEYRDGHLWWIDPTSNKVKKGQRFGCKDSNKYIRGSLKSQKYYEHSLIWFYHYGIWPKDQLDHINGIRDDNRIENLRECNNQQNSKNSAMKSSNTSGSTGVYWSKRDRRWIGEVMIGGNKIYIGRSKNIEEITSKVEKYRLQKGFSKRHGKKYLHT